MQPHLIEFDSIGSPGTGYISVCQQGVQAHFAIKRVYWTYFTPQSVTRGGHANIEKELILLAVAGTIIIETELLSGQCDRFVLDHPSKGLYLPKLCWHRMQYSHNAVQVVLASNEYNEADYIRDYADFKNWHQLRTI